jgi:hypothetical protein
MNIHYRQYSGSIGESDGKRLYFCRKQHFMPITDFEIVIETSKLTLIPAVSLSLQYLNISEGTCTCN